MTGELEVQDYSIVTKFKRRSRRRASESYEEFQVRKLLPDIASQIHYRR